MKNIYILFSICLSSICSFGQVENAALHEKFLQYIKSEKIDSLYHSYLKVNEADQRYEDALLFRNQYGWALHELEQLKKDIPAILQLSKYSSDMAYEKIFRPQKFPPSEWNTFLEMATELEKHFASNPNEYREILGIKTMLEFITKNDNALKKDLPKLIELLRKDSDAYSMMLWQYGNLLIRAGSIHEAISVFDKGWNQTADIKFLQSLIQLYSVNKEYEKVINFENQIYKDSSGILFFNLAEAYYNQNNLKNAEKHFKYFIEKFKLIDYNPFIQIEYDNTVYNVSPVQLELLGDFYLKKDKKSSCEYYRLASKIINNSSEDKFFQKQLISVKDEEQKSIMTSKFEKHKEEQLVLLNRLEKKLNECK